MKREQRLVFGEVAELYDQHRPAYPDALIDELVAVAGLEAGAVVLEVGPGTGKATAMFAARGFGVLGVEPSTEMAAVARRVCAGYPRVQIEQADFERWDPAGRTFRLLYAAQAWHWVEPDVGFPKAAAVLTPGGVLAAFWNRPVWAAAELREAVLEAYHETVPELLAETDPIHPGGLVLTDGDDWRHGVAATDGLGDVDVRDYEWCLRYSAAAYVALLQTHSTVRALEPQQREALVGAVERAIESHGDELTLPIVTLLCLARRLK